MNKKVKKRSYPPIYEKTLPLVLALLAAIMFALLVFAVAVGLGVSNFSYFSI